MLPIRTLRQLNTVKLSSTKLVSNQLRSIHVQSALLNNQSFFGAFRESVRRQIKENEDFNQGVKQLQDKSTEIRDSETLKRAKDLFNKARSDVSDSAATKQIQEGLHEVKKYADSVGKTVDEVLKEMNETAFIKATKDRLAKVGKTLYDTTEPIRQSEAYKAVKSDIETIVDDSSSRYGGYRNREARQVAKEKLDKKSEAGKARYVKANPEAGGNVVLHKDSQWAQSWKNFKDNSSLVQGLYSAKKSYDESDNSLVSSIRDVTDKISDTFTTIFAETEQAKAIKQIQMTVDPTFNLENFLREAREFMIPDILDAFHNADKIMLRQWCSEATFNVLKEGFKAQEQQGLIPDSQILDLRRVDVAAIKILDNDIPAVVVSFETQEIILFRKKTTKEVAFGREDHIERVRYVMVFTKSEADLENKHTNGWKVMEMARHSSSPSA